MHGKLRAMVSWVSSFYAVACALLCSCVCVYIRGGEQYLKGQTFYFSRSQKSQAGAGSVTFSLWWGRNITVEGNVEKCRGEERMESGGKEKQEGRRERCGHRKRGKQEGILLEGKWTPCDPLLSTMPHFLTAHSAVSSTD